MTKLSRMAVVAALAAFASTAAAQDGGWDTKYGMLFDLQNVFQNGSPAVYGSYGGNGAVGVGAQMNFGPQAALRLFLNLSRVSNPGYNETVNGLTYKVLPTDAAGNHLYTSDWRAKVGAQYMMRFTTAAVAPYAGVGASIRFDQDRIDGTETITLVPPAERTFDTTDRTWGLGVDGTLGLEWRVHKSIAIFAEYLVDLTLVSSKKHDEKITTPTTITTDKYTQTRYFNFNTGVGQGGQIGVLALF